MPLPLPELIIEVLKLSPDLADLQEWQPVNGLITLNAPGISVGVQKETYSEYDRFYDNCTSRLSVTVWDKDVDPAAGEARVREMAHAVRRQLLQNSTLGGAVDNVFVGEIEYLTEDAGSNLLLHIASLEVEVDYLAERAVKASTPAIENIGADTGKF
ncbi:hypothetical protein [Desulfofundulus thermosubterraneus]|uniref:Uncharacterized protein n=1 Tax=Desulfofundulus thermosubterraneus DSM 16057 TaxID=1121432 RepID=A0A1M6KMR9_9FIRM|nr:hypothetical protein [Desulfofundulus thermosubterraneus]SHJ60220.1 hypothetical protein SAMN02745219_02928 [Desulfofundulus thermosubterraneus DSM 16057]